MRTIIWNTIRGSAGLLLAIGVVAMLFVFLGSATAQPSDPAPVMLAQADAPPAGTELPEPIKPGEEIKTVAASVSELRGLASSGQWGPFASGVIALFLLLASTLMVRFKVVRAWLKPHQGEIAIILPALGCLGYEFAQIVPGSGASPWLDAMLAGAYAGAASVGFYEVAWKRWLQPLARKIWGWIKRKKADPK